MLGTTKLVEDIASLIKYDDSHNLAFNHNDSAFVVNGNSSRVLQNIGAKFTHELAILVVNLDLLKKIHQNERDSKRAVSMWLYFTCIFALCHILVPRGKSLLESWGTTFLPN